MLIAFVPLKRRQEVAGEVLDRQAGVLFLSARLEQWEIRYVAFSSWQAREAEFEAEQERIRREKEKEIARLRAMQEKTQDYRAEQVPA